MSSTEVGKEITLLPDEEWGPSSKRSKRWFVDQEVPELPIGTGNETPPAPKPKKCTCGISAIGGGMHSDWCDLSDE